MGGREQEMGLGSTQSPSLLDTSPPPPVEVGVFRFQAAGTLSVMFSSASAISMEIWMVECSRMFAELDVVGVFDLVGEGDMSKHTGI